VPQRTKDGEDKKRVFVVWDRIPILSVFVYLEWVGVVKEENVLTHREATATVTTIREYQVAPMIAFLQWQARSAFSTDPSGRMASIANMFRLDFGCRLIIGPSTDSVK
jgi:hypothetical protein